MEIRQPVEQGLPLRLALGGIVDEADQLAQGVGIGDRHLRVPDVDRVLGARKRGRERDWGDLAHAEGNEAQQDWAKCSIGREAEDPAAMTSDPENFRADAIHGAARPGADDSGQVDPPGPDEGRSLGLSLHAELRDHCPHPCANASLTFAIGSVRRDARHGGRPRTPSIHRPAGEPHMKTRLAAVFAALMSTSAASADAPMDPVERGAHLVDGIMR